MCNQLGNLFRMIILGGVALALTMQFLTTWSCDFLTDGNQSIGIWYYGGQNGVCNPTTQYISEDPLVAGARSALTISTILGFGAGVMVFFEWIFCEVCCAGCLEGLCFAGAWIAGGATFMLYGIEECGGGGNNVQVTAGTNGNNNVDINSGNNNCEWGVAGSYMVVACAAYFCCGFLLCCAPQPDPLCKQVR